MLKLYVEHNQIWWLLIFFLYTYYNNALSYKNGIEVTNFSWKLFLLEVLKFIGTLIKLIELSNIMKKVVNMVQLCSFVDFCLTLGYYIHVLGIQYFRLNMLDNKIQNPTQFITNWSWNWQRSQGKVWTSVIGVCKGPLLGLHSPLVVKTGSCFLSHPHPPILQDHTAISLRSLSSSYHCIPGYLTSNS